VEEKLNANRILTEHNPLGPEGGGGNFVSEMKNSPENWETTRPGKTGPRVKKKTNTTIEGEGSNLQINRGKGTSAESRELGIRESRVYNTYLQGEEIQNQRKKTGRL